jgi:trehalose/maltose transport system substrate-binding protein
VGSAHWDLWIERKGLSGLLGTGAKVLVAGTDIGSVQRAARWVGSISPPSVVGYTEWDALNVWVAGDAAFMRNWPTAYVDSQAAESPIRSKFDIALLPGGVGTSILVC